MVKKFTSKIKAAVFAAVVAATAIFGPAISSQAVTSVPYKWDNVVIGGGGGFMPGIVFNETEKDLIMHVPISEERTGGILRPRHGIPLLDHFQMDEYSYYGVESIATDPVDPNRVYIAAGMYTNDWLPNMGAILRSTDRGETWEKNHTAFQDGRKHAGKIHGRTSCDRPE